MSDNSTANASLMRGISNDSMWNEPNSVIRTDESAFGDIPEFGFAPHFREIDGLRLAHIDEGNGPPLLFVHGVPAWSYLWRRVMKPLLLAGYRCVAPDLAGFGRSDKPTALDWHTSDRHVAHLAHLLESLQLERVTLVVHDWGGSLGLRLAVEDPERIQRIVILDTDLHTGEAPKSEAWHAFRAMVEETEDLPIGGLISLGCAIPPSDKVLHAYELPFPTKAAKAGPRAFPMMHPIRSDDPDAVTMQHVRDVLHADTRPTLMIWGADDPVLSVEAGRNLAADIGKQGPIVLEGAGHFLQEDKGPEIGALIIDWLSNQH